MSSENRSHMLNGLLDLILIFQMSTLGGPFLVPPYSQHIFSSSQVYGEMDRRQEESRGGEQLER